MEQENNQENLSPEDRTKKLKGNAMLFIIMACWLLFYLYIGSKGGGG